MVCDFVLVIEVLVCGTSFYPYNAHPSLSRVHRYCSGFCVADYGTSEGVSG